MKKMMWMSVFGLAVLLLAASPIEAQIDTSAAAAESVRIDTLPPMASGYQWISYRGKADITDTGGTRTCSYFMVNRIDSILYLNVHAYGVEIMRMVFTPDSVIYVNKLGYNYYKGTYEPLRLLMGIPVSFNMLQAAFNGDTDKLPKRQKLAFEYHDFVAVDSTRSFFTQLIFKDLDHVLEIQAGLKSIKFDVPGPTSIRIPDKFQAVKLGR